jgi:general secretion pathway protein B
MSFILDALKKSESDRQRQSGPSLFEVKVAPPRRTLPVWAVAIAVLLGINVIVISWMLLRRPAAQQPPAASSQPAAPAIHDAAAARAAATPPPPQSSAGSGQAAGAGGAAAAGIAAPPTDHAAGSGQPAAPASLASSGQNASPPAAAENPSDNAPAVEPAATAGFATSGGGQAAGDMPLYQQIVTSDNLPPLHLDMHVFADRPQDRFVLINMHRLGEGDTFSGGVHVDAIRPDGVVLTYQGTQFLLPRN